MTNLLDQLEYIVRGLQAFPGNTSIRLDVKLTDLNELHVELQEEYGDRYKILPYSDMYVLNMHKEYNFYFSIKED